MSPWLLEMSPALGPPIVFAPTAELRMLQGVMEGIKVSQTAMSWMSVELCSYQSYHRQLVVNKPSVTAGMKYLLWLIEVCTEVEELIP